MTYTELMSTVYSHMSDNWTESAITYENTPYKPPVNDPWVRVSIVPFESENIAIGKTCGVRLRGLIAVQIFVRYDKGTGDAYELVDHAKEILENTTIGDSIYTYESSANVVGDSSRQLNHIESDWFQINVTTYFETSR